MRSRWSNQFVVIRASPLRDRPEVGALGRKCRDELEASPGIEPGCKDLQSRFQRFSNPLIFGNKAKNRRKTIGNQRQALADLGTSRRRSAENDTDESLT